MNDKRKHDRRSKAKNVSEERRKGPRRLVCSCGGKVEVIIAKNKAESFVCLRCGKKN
jgi:hypothetical protein